ncbi:serine hydrolase domain-containing protein [Tessaracoccus sp. O5.2]|uniref:serine hydrolase domain-containing protein n=1 Tax=Tessaracoccus sp. O5.2 TaxID=3157622 RepID=UPI0036DF69D9
MAQRSADLRLAGVAVVVVRDGDVYEESYLGTSGGGRPVTADTPFVLGSTSKQFTGLAVQRLIADGRLALDTTVAEVLPDVEADGDVGRMSVRQLLTHTSGLCCRPTWAVFRQTCPTRSSPRRGNP